MTTYPSSLVQTEDIKEGFVEEGWSELALKDGGFFLGKDQEKVIDRVANTTWLCGESRHDVSMGSLVRI